MSETPATDSTDSSEAVEAAGASGADGAAAAAKHGFLARLYTGTGAFEIVGKRKIFYTVTALVILACVVSIIVRGFSFGIEFEGGSRVTFPDTANASTSEVTDVFDDALGFEPSSVQTVGTGSSSSILIQSKTLSVPQSTQLTNALFDTFQPEDSNGVATQDTIGVSAVSSTWGGEITKKAIIALIVFLVLVGVYIGIRFERDMAVSALSAVLLDLIVTAGIYSIVGFQVSPGTVIGLLTILGYSLYDTVVVFDKVEENVEGMLHQRRRTYGEQANLAINQTLMRSINTSLTTILPILALIVIAVWMLGVGTLKDLSLVLLIGIAVGTYSSICTATPILVSLKERRKDIKRHNTKVTERRARIAKRGPAGDSADSIDAARDIAEEDEGGSAGDDRPGSDGSAPAGAATAGVAGRSGGGGPVDTPASAPRPGAKPAGSKRRKKS